MSTNVQFHETKGQLTMGSLFGRVLTGLAVGLAVAPQALAATWGTISAGACEGDGVRTYSAILWDIPWGQSWETACANQPATIDGQYFSRPTRCVNTGTNMWGEWDVVDDTCPHWGEIAAACYSEGVVQEWAILWDIPWGQSWEDACANESIPDDVSDAFYGTCWNGGLNMYGVWWSDEPSCTCDWYLVSSSCGPYWQNDCLAYQVAPPVCDSSYYSFYY